KYSHPEILHSILTKYTINLEQKNLQKQTPLFVATLNKHHQCINILLNFHAKILPEIDDHVYTPLGIACKNVDIVSVKILLANGADINKGYHYYGKWVKCVSFVGMADEGIVAESV